LESFFTVAASLVCADESIGVKEGLGRISKVEPPFLKTGFAFGFIPFEFRALVQANGLWLAICDFCGVAWSFCVHQSAAAVTAPLSPTAAIAFKPAESR
jgi:hypothetical protein